MMDDKTTGVTGATEVVVQEQEQEQRDDGPDQL